MSGKPLKFGFRRQIATIGDKKGQLFLTLCCRTFFSEFLSKFCPIVIGDTGFSQAVLLGASLLGSGSAWSPIRILITMSLFIWSDYELVAYLVQEVAIIFFQPCCFQKFFLVLRNWQDGIRTRDPVRYKLIVLDTTVLFASVLLYLMLVMVLATLVIFSLVLSVFSTASSMSSSRSLIFSVASASSSCNRYLPSYKKLYLPVVWEKVIFPPPFCAADFFALFESQWGRGGMKNKDPLKWSIHWQFDQVSFLSTYCLLYAQIAHCY